MSIAASVAQAAIKPFQSLTKLREAHTELLKRHRDTGSSSEREFIDATIEFVRRARATGVILDQDDDRCIAQGLIDYWLTIIYRSGREFPDSEATLEDFDISRQPELKSSDCPYIGLETFSETKTEFFFGRRNLVKLWIERLAEQRLLAVVGPSGSGKASLISAGVVPALRSGALPGSESWRYFPLIAPGAHPLRNLIQTVAGAAASNVDELVAAMRKNSKTLLGLVEQDSNQPALLVFPRFEEVFTLANEEERKTLGDNLLELVRALRGHHVLVAIRSEFVGHVAQLGPLQTQFHKGEVFVPPFDSGELREIVEQPAKRIGLKFEDGLVDALIFDVLGDPAALPVLQFTLLKLWDRRERNRITWKAFREIGGCRGAFEKAANEMFSQLNPSEQETAKAILLRIVRPGAGREIISSSVRRSGLYKDAESHEQIDRVIDALAHAGLVRISGDNHGDQRIGMVNEALVMKWPRLLEWLEDERTEMRQRQRLTIAAAQWKEKGEDPDALWGGLLLEEARTYGDLNDLEEAFVGASVRAKERRSRLRRRLQAAAVSVLVLGICLLGLTLWLAYLSLKETRKAVREANVERGMRLLAEGNPAAGTVEFARPIAPPKHVTVFLPSGVEIDIRRLAPLLNWLPGLQLRNEIKTNVYRRRLEIGLRQVPRLLNLLPHDREAVYAELSGEGRHVVTLTTGAEKSVEPSDDFWATGAQTAWVWTITGTGSSQPRRLQSDLPANSVRISPDGKLVVSAHGEPNKGPGEVRIWDITGPEPNCIHKLQYDGAITLAIWSRDGNRVAFAQQTGKTSRGKLMVWDWRTESAPGKSLEQEKISLLAWSPRGDRIAIAQQKGEARVWDLTSDNLTYPLKSEKEINEMVFSSDGKYVLTASGIRGPEAGTAQTESGAAQIWDAENGERSGPPLSHKGAVRAAQFSPDDKLVVTASADGTAKVWSATTGREMLALPHDAQVFCATFSPDGRYVATGGRDRMVRVWDLLSGKLAVPPMNHSGTVGKIVFSSDGRELITTSKEIPRVWAFATGIKPPPALNVDGLISWAAFSRDGSRLVTLSEAEPGKVWRAQVWEALNGDLVTSYEQRDLPLTRAVISDDGSRVGLGSGDADKGVYQALVINASTGKPLYKPITLDGDPIFIAFGHGEARHFVTLTRDSKEDTTNAQVWNASSGEPLSNPLRHDSPVYFATLSPDNSLLLTTGGEHNPGPGKAFIWQVRRGDQQPKTLTHSEMITHGEFSPNGQQIVTASEDNYARVWQTTNGQALSPLLKDLHTADLTDVSFSPDGNRILTASYDRTAVVCDWRQQKIVSIFTHAGVVNRATFSRDGQRVITASIDGTARLWDVETRELIAMLSPGGPVQEAAFSSDGNAVFALSYNAAHGSEASFQKGVPASTVPDDVLELPRSTAPMHTWNITVEGKHPDADLQAIAELLACGSNEQLDKTGELVKKWRRLLSRGYLSDFRAEPAIDYHTRCAISSEAAKQWFAAAWHRTKLLENKSTDPETRRRRAIAYSRLGKAELAIDDLNVALGLQPENAALLNLRAQAFAAKEDWEAAARDSKTIIRRTPSSAEARFQLAAVRCQEEQWDEAVGQLEAILKDDPNNLPAWQRLALVQLKRNDFDSYRRTCSRMLDKFKDMPNFDSMIAPKFGSMIAWPCILGSRSVEDMSVIVDLAGKAVEYSPRNYYRANTRAAALYRAGEYRKAIVELDRSRNLFANSAALRIAALRDDSFLQTFSEPRQGRAVDWVFLAMAKFMIGDRPGAEWWLGKVRQTVEGQAAVGTETSSDRRLWNKMELELLYQEANGLIGPVAISATAP
jgi:WD40 repeat protein/tetratricopeptide (TPR) repeat protein